jgi:peroxiredoxin
VSDGTDEPNSETEQAQFSAKVGAAWTEIEEYYNQGSENGEDHTSNPQRRLAPEFFDLYLARRPGPIAEQATQHAFAMWSNLEGGSQLIEAALPQVGDDEEALAAVFPTILNAFNRDERGTEVDGLTESLLNHMQTAEQRSEALFSLVRNWMWSGESAQARVACEKIIAWNASPHYVEQCKYCLHELDNLNLGQMAPVFKAQTIDGRHVDLARMRGKVVLLDFWATWCSPCRGEFPHLRRVWERFSGQGLVLLSISLDEDCDAARRMIDDEHLTWTHVCEGGWDNTLAKLYNVMGIPKAFLIDREGRIVAKDLREHDVDLAVAKLM